MSGAACTCPIHWRQLYTDIEGVRDAVEPTLADTAASLLFRAWCVGCGAEYTYPFRLAAERSEAA